MKYKKTKELNHCYDHLETRNKASEAIKVAELRILLLDTLAKNNKGKRIARIEDKRTSAMCLRELLDKGLLDHNAVRESIERILEDINL